MITKRFIHFFETVEGKNRGAQSRFAENIGCGRAQVSSWLKGRATPSNYYESKMIEVYHLNLNWLKHGEGKMFLSKDSERKLLKPVVDEGIPVLFEDDPFYDQSFIITKIIEDDGVLRLQKTDRVKILDRIAARNEMFLQLPQAIPEEKLNINDKVTIRKIHKDKIISGRPHLIECEKGIVLSVAYKLRDGRILVHLNESEDFVPKDIMSCYQILPIGREPYLEYEPTEEEQLKIDKIVRDFHNKERAGKTYMLVLSLHLLLYQVTFMMMHIAASYKYDAVVAWPRLIFIHLLFIVVNGIPIYLYKTSKRAAEEFTITRWMMCFKKKFSRITNRLACD